MKITESFEQKLYRKGFPPVLRKIIMLVCMIAAVLLLFGVLALPFGFWFFWLGIGAALSAWNFFSLAYFIQKSFYPATLDKVATRQLMASQIILSNLRLFITGILVYSALVMWQANPFALVAGLSLSVIMIPIVFLVGLGNNAK